MVAEMGSEGRMRDWLLSSRFPLEERYLMGASQTREMQFLNTASLPFFLLLPRQKLISLEVRN